MEEIRYMTVIKKIGPLKTSLLKAMKGINIKTDRYHTSILQES